MPTKNFMPPLRALYSLEAASKMAGVSPKLLNSAIENGDIPGVRVLSLGPRNLRHVRSLPFLSWLEGVDPPKDPGEQADADAVAAVAKNFDPVEFDDNLFI